MEKQSEIAYQPIEELTLEKEKTVFITSFARAYSSRTNFYYQRHEMCKTIQSAIEQGKDTFLSMNKTLFEVLYTSEILYWRKQYPNIKIYHVCFKPPNINSSAWKEYIEFTRFCSIQSELDGSYYFVGFNKYCDRNKCNQWIVEHSSLIIGYFSLQEFVSSITTKVAKELQIPIINLFDDRMNTEKIGGSIPFEVLSMVQDSELKKIISRNYHSYYGALIRGTVFGSSLYHKYSDKKSEVLQQLSSNTISPNTIRKLTLELNEVEMKILKLIAEKSYQVGNTATLPDRIKQGRKKRNVQ